MKKILSIILIITMLLSVVLSAIPAFAETAGATSNAGSTVTMPTLPDKGVVNAATGATAIAEPALPAIGTSAGQANIGNTKVSKTDTAYKNARAAEGYIPIVNDPAAANMPSGAIKWNQIAAGGNYYLYEDINNPGTGGRINANITIDGCGHTVTKNGSLFDQTQGTLTLKNITFKAEYTANGGTQTMLSQWGTWGNISLYNVSINGKVTYKNTYTSQYGGLFTLNLNNQNGTSIIDNVKIDADLIIDKATTVLPCIGLLAGVAYNGVQFSNVVSNGSITIKEGTVIDANTGSTQSEQWLQFMGGLVGEATGARNGVYSKLENIYSDIDINIEKNVDITGVNRDGSYPSNPKTLRLGGIVGNTDKATYRNVVNKGDITIASGAKLRLYGMGGIAGVSTNESTFENCHNLGNITIYDGVTMHSEYGIGGIVSTVADKALTFKNCVNGGNITVGALASGQTASESWEAKIKSIGGIVNAVNGVATINSDVNSSANTYSFDTCFNKGNITLGAGIYLPYADNTQVSEGMGGIVGRINGNVAFKNCANNGDIVSNGKLVRCFGGIAGTGYDAINVSFVNCINGATSTPADGVSNGNIKIKSRLEVRDYPAAGGIYGMQYLWGKANLVRFYSCTNNGKILDTTTEDTKGKLVKGGIAAVIRGVKDVIFYNCINNGEVKTGALTNGESMSSGILGFYATVGDWMGVKDDDSMLKFERCTNNAPITGYAHTAGILASISEIRDGGKGKIRNFVFKDCLNTKKIEKTQTEDNVGGLVGYFYGGGAKINASFENCENRGEVKGKKNNVGGIIGNLGANAPSPRFYIKDCENTGTVSASYNVAGIVGRVSIDATNTDGIGQNDYVPGLYIEGCVNNNSITGAESVSGILGTIDGNDGSAVSISGCYNGTNGVLTANRRVAGIFSEIKRATTISGCYNLAAISGNEGGFWAGGIVAKITASLTLNDSENYGDITYSGDAWYDHNSVNWGTVGGVAGGVLNASTVELTGCKNYGKIELTSASTNAGIGGVMGHAWNGATVTFRGCENNGAVVNNAKHYANNNDIMGTGGILGTAGRAATASTVYFYGCSNNASVSLGSAAKNYSVGGILGFLVKGSATFGKNGETKTTNNGAVSAAGTGAEMLAVGGIAGRIGVNGYTSTATFNDCVNNSAVSATGSTYNVGGIVGNLLSTNATFTNCINSENATVTDASTARSSWQGMGGIVGYLFGYYANPEITMTGCINEGVVAKTGTAGAIPAGGMVGFMRAVKTMTFEDCHNEGDVSSTGEGVGGMVGRYGTIGTWAGANTSKIEFTDCTNTASLTAKYRVGGMLGDTTEVLGTDVTEYKHEFIFDGCINSGTITTTAEFGDRAGGMAGYIGNGGYKDEKNSSGENVRINYGGGYNIVSFNECINSGTINSYAMNGGMLGIFEGYGYKQSLSFVDCENTGTMNVKTQSGGLVGYTLVSFKNNKVEEVYVDKALGKDPQSGARLDTFDLTVDNFLGNGAIIATRAAAGDKGNDSAGLVGMLQVNGGATESFDTSIMFKNVEVKAPITAAGDTIGGYIGYFSTNAGELDMDFEKCINTANITTGNGAGSGGSYTAAFVGNTEFAGSAIVDLDFTDCVNTGNVTGNSRVSGFMGSVYLHSDNAKTALDVNIEKCVNEGNIAGYGGEMGGFVGYARANYKENDEAAKKDELKISINDCMNLGNITAGSDKASSMVGAVVAANDKTEVRISDVSNTGNISAGFRDNCGGNAGGIFGVCADSVAKIYIDGAINYGSVSSCKWNCFGIYAQNYVNKTGQYSEIKNVFNFGKLYSSVEGNAQEKPIGWVDTMEEAYFYIGCIDEGTTSDNGAAVKRLDWAYEIALELCDKPFTFENLLDAMTKAEPYFENSEKYAEDTWLNLKEKYDVAKEMVTTGFYWITNEGTVTFLEQAEIEEQKDAILDAIDNTYLKSAMPILLENTIADAEKFIENIEDLYTEDAWQNFMDAYNDAKALYAQDNLQEMNYATIYPVANALKLAMEALKTDESALGGKIYNEGDLASLDGKNGVFELQNDITVSEAIKNFKGTIIGNGYTITLDGSALFEKADGATVVDLKIAGDAGEAKSIFGAAKGEIVVEGLTIDVDGTLEAALFHEVDAKSKLDVSDVFSYTDASVAALVAGNCEIKAENILVMAEAPALVTAAEADVKLAYVSGVVYYNAEGAVSTDAKVFASGEVAYVMNEAMGTPGLLVQRIGDDTLPVISASLPDGSNVIGFKDGQYVNLGTGIDVTVNVTPKPQPETEVALTDLANAIIRAELISKDNYTEESYKAVADAIEAAKKALAEKGQSDVDKALLNLEVAVASLETKKAEVAKVDISKLTEAIKKAEALKLADYTGASWTTVSIMLTMAKTAKIADTQAEVDSAVAALESAMANLVKAPVVEAPAADNKDDKAPVTEEDGCGSVVGTAAVIAVAVMTLGAGISFKKKED